MQKCCSLKCSSTSARCTMFFTLTGSMNCSFRYTSSRTAQYLYLISFIYCWCSSLSTGQFSVNASTSFRTAPSSSTKGKNNLHQNDVLTNDRSHLLSNTPVDPPNKCRSDEGFAAPLKETLHEICIQ